MRKLPKVKLVGNSRCDTCHWAKHTLHEGQTRFSVYCTNPIGELTENCTQHFFEKKPYPLNAPSEATTAKPIGRPPLLRRAIKDWFLDTLRLSGGTIPAATILSAAKERGLKLATLYRAKKELHIKSVAYRKNGKIVWYWV